MPDNPKNGQDCGFVARAIFPVFPYRKENLVVIRPVPKLFPELFRLEHIKI
jgi:hypothetical protein